MNFEALIQMALPLLSQFLSNKSGSDLAGLVNNNQELISKALGGLATQTQSGAQSDNSVALLATLLPVLLKQQPVVVVPKDGGGMAVTDSGNTPQSDLSSLEARIANLEKIVLAQK